MDKAQGSMTRYFTPRTDIAPMPRALFGPGMFERAGDEARQMGMRRALVVTTGLRGTGFVEELLAIFREAGVATVLYDGVQSNPKTSSVMAAYQSFAGEQCDGFVSLGGGSAHDATKAARYVAAHDGRAVNEFRGAALDEWLATPPQIAINTTAGTGAETTRAAVLTDDETANAPFKWVLAVSSIAPTLAINDPLLHVTTPPDLTAFTAFDVVSHACETVLARAATPHSRALGLEALELCAQWMREAVGMPKSLPAREGMMWAQYLAAVGFSSGGLGVIHGISHAVSAFYDSHHGLNNAVVLPYALANHAQHAPGRMRWIAEALGERVDGLSDTAAADRAVAAVTRLCVDLEMPENFTQAGPYTKSQVGQGKFAEWGGPRIAGDERDIARVTQHVIDDGRWNNNPNEMTPERIRRIVTASMMGTR